MESAIYYPMPTSGFLCLCYFSHVKSAKRKNRFSKTKLKSQIGKTPKRKRPVSRHTHKNRTAFERLSNGIQTLFFMQKKTQKSIVNSAKIRIFT